MSSRQPLLLVVVKLPGDNRVCMEKILAENKNYKVTYEYEMVTLHFKTNDRKPIYIGDFYGDPDSAIISWDEKYIAITGCGIIIYNLQEPFSEYYGDESSKQYFVFNNTEPNIWWTSNVHQSVDDIEPKFFRFSKEEDLKDVPYRFDTSTNKAEKLL